MKQRIIWLPTLIVLICSTMLTGCVTLKEFAKEAGITVGVLAVAGIISLFDEDDSKKNSNDKNQVEKANHTISINNFHKEIEDINFSSKEINTIKLTGTYTENDFKAFISSIYNVDKVALDLSKLKNMKEVPARVFVGKENLVKIYLPETIEKINSEAFYDCKNLEQISIPENTKFIESCAFKNCSSLTNIILPKSLEQIAPSTFENCKNLTSIELPKSVKSIDVNAFRNCASLEKIKFNSNLAVIKDYAFYKCTALKQISLSDSVTELGIEVFANCSSLEKVVLPNKITQISLSLFENCSSLVSVNIPNTVTEIDSSAFSNCISLKEILIPSSVKQIGWYAFRNCSNLTTVKINGCVDLGRCSFIDCKNLKNVIFTSEIQDLGFNTFENCVSLKTITFPNIQDKSINYVFLGCANLEKVIFAEGATEIILDASDFSDCKKLKSIELPSSFNVNSILASGNFSDDFKFVVDSKNSFISVSSDGKKITSKDGKTLYTWVGASGDVTVPDGITTIEKGVFANNQNITSVKIPNFVEFVNEDVFSNCTNLETVVFPEKLKSGIYEERWNDETYEYEKFETITINFNTCEKLKSVVFPKNITYVNFSDCNCLESFVFPSTCQDASFKNCKNLKTVEIDEGRKILTLQYKCFEGCANLEVIKIPSSIEFIGYKHEKHPIFFPLVSDSPKLKFQVDSNNEYFSTADNGKMLTSKDGKTLYSWAGLSGDVTIPKNISIIENSSSIIEGYDIKTLTIPEHVEFLGGYSFSNGNIEKLIINSKEIKLAESVFYNCKNLKSVVINGNLSNKYFAGPGWRGDGSSVFSDCKNLESFEFYGKIINHDNTRSESFSTWFYKCEKLNNVILSNRIISLYNPFEGCQSLKEINFLGTKSEWNKIEIDMESDTILQNAKINFLPKR